MLRLFCHARYVYLMIAGCMLAGAALAAAPLVNATLEPTQISVGESAQLTITTSGTTMAAPTLPTVSGLDFGIVGQSRRIEIINGAMLATTSTIVRVTPQVAGIFTIPGITPNSQPLVLRVNPDNGSNSSSTSRGNFSSLGKPPIVPNGTANGAHLSADGSAFVHLNIPKRDIYVGESIPVDIQVGMRAGFVTSLNGLPTINGGGDFTLNNLSHQPERVEKLIDGQPFTLLTWHSVMAAVKPGKFSLSVETPLTVRVRVRPARDSIIDDMLGDPFMQNFFGSTVSKEINVSSPTSELTVLALPTKDRPADFSGAVGSFKISSDLSSSTAPAGDPLTLRMHVTGAGNFDRVDSPMLDHVEHWKTYPPKSTFTPTEATGYKGEKVFEQPLIAAQPGSQTLPGLNFSYFDPVTARYETVHSAPLTVNISPSLAETAPTAPSVTSPAPTPLTAGQAAAPAHPAPAGLRPDHDSSSPRVHSLMPLYLQPRFLAIPGAVSLAFVGVWLVLRRRAGDRARGQMRAPSKEAQRVLAQLQSAADAGDAASFFNTAKSALQERLAVTWDMAAAAVTTDEVESRARDDKDADLRYIFAFADEVRYSGHDSSRIDFSRWIQRIERRLTEATVAVLFALALAAGFAPSPARAASGDAAPVPSYSASDLYNTANAYARQGKPGLAILNYERARLLGPGDPDIEANLAFVRQSSGLPPPATRDGLARVLTALARTLASVNPDLFAWTGLVGLILAGVCLLSAGHLYRHRWALRGAAAVGLLLVAATVADAVALWPTLHEGIVLAAATPARVSPVPMGEPLFVLQEGESVRVAATHEGFVLVESSAGRLGWVAQSNVSAVVLH